MQRPRDDLVLSRSRSMSCGRRVRPEKSKAGISADGNASEQLSNDADGRWITVSRLMMRLSEGKSDRASARYDLSVALSANRTQI